MHSGLHPVLSCCCLSYFGDSAKARQSRSQSSSMGNLRVKLFIEASIHKFYDAPMHPYGDLSGMKSLCSSQAERQRGDSNPRGRSPMDFKSISPTTRTHRHGQKCATTFQTAGVGVRFVRKLLLVSADHQQHFQSMRSALHCTSDHIVCMSPEMMQEILFHKAAIAQLGERQKLKCQEVTHCQGLQLSG